MRGTGLALLQVVFLTACASSPPSQQTRTASPPPSMPRPFVIWPEGEPLPTEGYDHPPARPFNLTDLFIQTSEMRSFYGPPGEFGYYIDGADYGFQSLSFILTETHPGGGPDLHQHDSEEAHVLLSGNVTYQIGNERFTVDGPYIARVPAGVPHTFLNSGSTPLHLLAVFPTGHPAYIHIGDNPLINNSFSFSRPRESVIAPSCAVPPDPSLQRTSPE